jgi:hypothetical protein
MTPIEPLILDLLEWLAPGPRPYADVMDAWRTSCPRLTVWEDSLDRGYVVRQAAEVVLTAKGRRHLLEAAA